MLYFAYGSNMSSRRLLARIDSARLHGRARLADHDLRFHKIGRDGSGKCDVVAHAGSTVHGVVFRIDPRQRKTLDRFEGLGQGYEGIELEATNDNGDKLEVFLYQATHTAPFIKPYDWYKQHVLHGAEEHGLPTEYQQRLRATPSLPDPESERFVRELEIYRQTY